MTRDNVVRTLRAFCNRRPFLSFVVELVSGDRVLVAHPEALAWRGDVLIYRSPQGKQRAFDSESVCQLLDVP